MYKHLVWLVAAGCGWGQTCSLTVSGQNQARRVMGPVNTECPNFVHTTPFGNWGVTSNFGAKIDGHQFQGWCRNSFVCDNTGVCRTECRSDWYQWNSCTDHPAYRAPNSTYYNSAGGTEQVSPTGVNTHGSRTVEVPVACPGDADGDGLADTGGCRLVQTYSGGTNFMSLYELDPVGSDELVQTLYFPDTPVSVDCGPLGCAPSASEWVAPNGYDSPKTPARVSAEMRTLVASGVFVDRNNACRASTAFINTVSGATFRGNVLAPESIGSTFGLGFAASPANASGRVLPQVLGGVSMRITDSAGTSRNAGLFHVSPTQINFELPNGLATGEATIVASRGDNIRWTGRITIERASPGLFSADSSGEGPPAALVTRVSASGAQSVEPAFDCSSGKCVAREIDVAAPAYLTLFGTGIRYGSQVAVLIGGVSVTPMYAGSQTQFYGLDQVNFEIPRSLQGRGDVEVWVLVDGKASNRLRLSVK